MAGWTSADADTIRRALATGALRVDIGGKSVTYRSVSELRTQLTMIEDALAAAAGAPPIRLLNPILTNGLRTPCW